MAYEVTATRKRPQSFDELVGQEFVSSTIRHSIEQGRIAHAYLFGGPRGVGKTSVARLLAKSLNCESGPTPKPCGNCSSCQEIARGAALDVIEIDGASNTSVNDVREIRDEVLFAPNSSRYKIYIIDEVHMLSNSAFNALLKTIEEPPPYVVFVFATTEIQKVPATIRSRCQQFTFRLIPSEEIVRLLGQAAAELGVAADADALFWIAKESTGSMRDAYTLLDQAASFSGGTITLKGIREKLGVMDFETMNELADGIRRRDAQYVITRTHDILSGGIAIEQFVVDMAEYFRNVLFLKHGIRRQHLLGYPPDQFRQDVVDAFSSEQIEKAIELLMELYRHLRYTLSPMFELELVMSRLVELDRLVLPADVLEAIASARSDSGGARSAPASRTVPGSAPEDWWSRTVETCKKEKSLLGPALEKAASHELGERVLTLTFRAEDRFQAQMVETEQTHVAKAVSSIVGRELSVETKVLHTEGRKETPGDDRVELVKRIFRGEVVEGGS